MPGRSVPWAKADETKGKTCYRGKSGKNEAIGRQPGDSTRLQEGPLPKDVAVDNDQMSEHHAQGRHCGRQRRMHQLWAPRPVLCVVPLQSRCVHPDGRTAGIKQRSYCKGDGDDSTRRIRVLTGDPGDESGRPRSVALEHTRHQHRPVVRNFWPRPAHS